jgi:hypothetical protein
MKKLEEGLDVIMSIEGFDKMMNPPVETEEDSEEESK